MNVSYAAKILRGNVAGRNTVLCPGPGHSFCDRSLSVTFRSGSDFTVFSYAGDDWRECKDHVRQLLAMSEVTHGEPGPIPEHISPPPEDCGRIERAVDLWREAGSIRGTLAEAYLESRGVSYQGEALRWHPSCPFGKGVRHGCMIALVRNIITDEPQAVHRTALDGKGRKIGRKAFGPIGGGAVKLTEDADVIRTISIGEGLETTLSIRELPELDKMTVWAVLSANGISAFPVLPGIESVWIAADNDASGTGENAAHAAGERLHAAGVETIILKPIQLNADLNDRVARRA